MDRWRAQRRNRVARSKKNGHPRQSTCVMNYDEATGYLLGDEHKGMRAMFTMMNEARLGVGLQGYASRRSRVSKRGDLRQRPLARPRCDGYENPDGPADPLIVHPDIRRNLMDQKSFIEGARAFTLLGCHT